jgi:hypothetical protein
MQDHEAGGRPLYDHANDDPRPSGRRRRPAADWGVGEEIFDRLPSRRFVRDSHRPIPRGGADDGRRTIVITGAPHADDEEADPALAEEFASREDALRAREENEALWGGEEPFADERRRGDESLGAASWGPAELGERAPVDEAFSDPHDASAPDDALNEPAANGHDVIRGGVAGRRTVKIGGRPGEIRTSYDRTRRRPPRTVGERLGARPDRVAAWAFMLGLVLILIAVVTAKADASEPAKPQAQTVTAPAPTAVEVRPFTTAR